MSRHELDLGSRPRDRRTMADSTRLSILPSQRGRIEPGPMGVEATAAECRMAGKTITFRMTGDAALEILSCCLTMPQEKGTPRIVIPRVQLSSSAQSSIHVAISTELGVVVAVAAVGLPRVRRSWVSGEKARRVISWRRVSGVGAVAVEALWTHMTALARLRPAVRHRPMDFGEILPM